MQSKLSGVAANWVESAWLVAVVTVPIFFNFHSERIFEPDKILLLRTIALALGAGLAVWAVEQGSRALWLEWQPVWRLLLVKWAVLLTAAYLTATAFSIVPAVSWWGGHDRCQGTYTWLSYMAVFAGVALLVRGREQVERVVTAALLASLPVAAYGLIQHFGRDPIAWQMDVSQRVTSTAGNAIFLSAYLIMVLPLTVARLLTQLGRWRAGGPPSAVAPGRFAAAVLAVAYLLLATLQLLAIVYSQSRGPFAGLLLGLIFFVLVFALCRRWRWLARAVPLAAAAGLVALLLLNLRGSGLKNPGNASGVGRLGQVFALEQGSGKVRVLIWQGVSDLLRADPMRDLIGYGPETLFFAYSRFYPANLAHFESRKVSADRSHNEIFDALVTTGVIGLLAELAVFLSLVVLVLRRLGLLDTVRRRRACAVVAIGGGLLGAAIGCGVAGDLRFFGIGLAAGLVGGVLAYLVGLGFGENPGRTGPAPPQSLLLMAILAAVMAHFVELQVGIAVVATRLYFWLYAGLAIAIARTAAEGDGRDGHGELPAQRSAGGDVLGLGTLVGLILVVLTFDFYKPTAALSAQGYILVWLFAGVWLFAAIVVIAQSAGDGDGWLARALRYAAISLGVWLLFLAVYRAWMTWSPPGGSAEQIQQLAVHLTHGTSVLYGFVVFVLGLCTAAMVTRGALPPIAVVRPRGWQVLLYPALLVIAGFVAVRTNLDAARADVFSRQAHYYESRNHWQTALPLRQESTRLVPYLDYYILDVARTFMELGRRAGRAQSQQRDHDMEQSDALMRRAWRAVPSNMDSPRGLARLHRTWAQLLDDPVERARHFGEAEGYYQHALEIRPNNASLWDELALLYVERHDAEEALATLKRSLEVDDLYPATFFIRGNLYSDLGRFDEALADYDRALAIQPDLVPLLSAKAFVLSRLDRLDEAITLNQRILDVRPKDLIAHRNLAALYRQKGDSERALLEAQAALAIAPAQAQPPLRTFIDELREEQGPLTKLPTLPDQ